MSSAKSLRALVIDDDHAALSSFALLLEAMHISSVCASDGMSALQYLSASSFDIIILDFGLPDIRGDELAKRLREESARTPIIMISGNIESMPLQALDVDRLLSKPVARATLVETILQLVAA